MSGSSLHLASVPVDRYRDTSKGECVARRQGERADRTIERCPGACEQPSLGHADRQPRVVHGATASQIKPWKRVMTVSQSVKHHTARLNGINQHWVSAGDGPPVYLLHGFPETWFAWRKQIPVLAERYTVIAPDLRGYGDTEKPACGYDKRTMAHDLAALIDHLGHERAPILGHDRGARVGTRFAKDHRERIDRFVAMDNVPPRILMENPGRAGKIGWFVAFLGV